MKKTAYALGGVGLLVFIAVWLNLQSDAILQLDTTAASWFKGNELLAVFHYIGEPAFVVVVVALLMAFLWLRKNYRAMFFVLIANAGGMVLNQAFKYAIQRPRPERLEQLSSFSFPSGHSMGGIIYLFTLAYIFTHYTTSQKRAYIVWLGAAILTILIGLSRIAESRHFGSDVLGGFSLGFAWFMLSVFWYEYRERVIKRQ